MAALAHSASCGGAAACAPAAAAQPRSLLTLHRRRAYHHQQPALLGGALELQHQQGASSCCWGAGQPALSCTQSSRASCRALSASNRSALCSSQQHLAVSRWWSPAAAASSSRRARRRFAGVVPSASNTEGGGPNGPKRGSLWSWLTSLGSQAKLQTPLKVAFNLAVLYVLMRIWPLGGRGGLGGGADNVVVQLPFSEFVKRARADELQSVAIDGTSINFALRPSSTLLAQRLPDLPDASKVVTFYSVRPADYALPYEVMERNGVLFTAVDKKGNQVVTVMVYALFVGMLLSALVRLPLKLPNQKGPGRKHKQGGENGERPIVTFADVAGVDEAKEELAEIVDYLRAPDKFSRLGARPPSGVLLVGPPGTGKTLLAKAVAGEADVPFFSISASEFVELYVGMGAMRVRELFAAARKEAPAIVFIDEIDAVAKGRDMRLRGVGNDEREQTLNQLLTELDGFDSDKDHTVICIAATNRPDVLDAALLRPGRFDRRVTVERPDKTGREQILKVHLSRRGLPLSNDVSVSSLAGGTTGFTGADLANLVNEAALLAGRRSKAEVGREEFDAAILRAVAGLEKKRSILVGVEKEVVAKHEAGHALVATAISRLLPLSAAEVEKLSIIPRSGGALGFTYIPPKTEDRALMFDSEIRGQLAMLMGGRAAEQITCDAVSTGASDDIRRATDLAQRAVSEFGLSGSVGPLNVGVLAAGGADDGGLGLAMGHSGMARLVEAEVKALVEGALCCALEVVAHNGAVHEGLSRALCKRERMEGADLAAWLQHVQVPESLSRFIQHGQLPSRQALAWTRATAPEGPRVQGLPSGAALGQSDSDAEALPAAAATAASNGGGVVAASQQNGADGVASS